LQEKTKSLSHLRYLKLRAQTGSGLPQGAMPGCSLRHSNSHLNKELSIKLPLSGLPQGIAEVTLFNSSLKPVAERLVYVNQDLKLYISAELSKEI